MIDVLRDNWFLIYVAGLAISGAGLGLAVVAFYRRRGG